MKEIENTWNTTNISKAYYITHTHTCGGRIAAAAAAADRSSFSYSYTFAFYTHYLLFVLDSHQ